MKKAVFAGAIALAMMGPLLVSEHGFGPAPASAQEVVVTEGKIARLRGALRLSGEQIAALASGRGSVSRRHAIRSSARLADDGWVQKVRDARAHLCEQRDGAAAGDVGGGPADREPRRAAARERPQCAALDGRQPRCSESDPQYCCHCQGLSLHRERLFAFWVLDTRLGQPYWVLHGCARHPSLLNGRMPRRPSRTSCRGASAAPARCAAN